MVTYEQRADFERDGLLFLPEAVPAAVTVAMRDRLWGFLSAMHGRRPDDPATWKAIEDRARFKMLMRTGAFDDVSEHLVEPITDVLGDAWDPPDHWGHPLVTFPDHEREWAIPARGWHVDSTRWSVGALLPGVVAFTFLDDVRPRGGGTLLVAGSHHLTWRLCQRAGGFMRTGEMKAALADDHSWFAELWREPSADPDRLRRCLDEGAVVDGTHVRVVELSGRPGDVVLMNKRVLHVAAPNVRSTPRMMLSDFITRRTEEDTS